MLSIVQEYSFVENFIFLIPSHHLTRLIAASACKMQHTHNSSAFFSHKLLNIINSVELYITKIILLTENKHVMLSMLSEKS